MSWGLELYSLRDSLVRGHVKVSKACLIKKEWREKKDKKSLEMLWLKRACSIAKLHHVFLSDKTVASVLTDSISNPNPKVS